MSPRFGPAVRRVSSDRMTAIDRTNTPLSTLGTKSSGRKSVSIGRGMNGGRQSLSRERVA